VKLLSPDLMVQFVHDNQILIYNSRITTPSESQVSPNILMNLCCIPRIPIRALHVNKLVPATSLLWAL